MASNDIKPVAAKAAAAPVVAQPASIKPASIKPASIKPAPVKAATPKPVAVRPAAKSPVPLAPPAAVTAVSPLKELPMTDTVKTVTDKSQAQAKAMFADAQDRTKGAMEKSAKLFEDINDFGKGNVEALVESSKIAAKGIETLSEEAAAYTRKSLEGATAALKTFASVKSPTEFMKLQSDYVRSSFDAMIAQASHSTEAMLKLAGEVSQPISNRMAVAAEKVKISA